MDKQERFLTKAATVVNGFLFVGGASSLLALAYFYYQYNWSGNRKFGGWMGVLVYYALPAVTAGILFGALKLKPIQKINFAMVCAAMIVPVFGFELYLEMTYSPLLASGKLVMDALRASKEKQTLASQLAKQYGVEVDMRTRSEVIADLSRKGIEAVPSVIPRYQLRYFEKENAGSGGNVGDASLLALAGISNKTTVLCNEGGPHVLYESDEHGFHNPKGLWNSGRIDIASVGDSFVQGYCVPSDRNFMALIRKQYPATANLGMAGEGPLLMLATIREYAEKLKPRVVLWFYFEGNDLLDLQEERQSPLLMRYLDDNFSQRLLEKQNESDKALMNLVESERRAALKERNRREAALRQRSGIQEVIKQTFSFFKLAFLRQRLGLVGKTAEENAVSSDVEGQMDLFREILLRARTRVGSWGGTLWLVYLPDWTRYDKGRPTEYSYRVAMSQRPKVLKLANDLGIPIIDIHPAFERYGDPMSLFPFRGPGHYNAMGHRLVAEVVLKALASGELRAQPVVRTNS